MHVARASSAREESRCVRRELHAPRECDIQQAFYAMELAWRDRGCSDVEDEETATSEETKSIFGEGPAVRGSLRTSEREIDHGNEA